MAPLRAKDGGAAYDAAALAAAVRQSVVDVVKHQIDLGIDVVDDGEHSKSSFTAYLRTRLSGFSQTDKPYNARPPTRDYLAFPAVYDENKIMLAARPCPAPRHARRHALLRLHRAGELCRPARKSQADIDNLKAALAAHPAPEAFITALSPNNLEVYLSQRILHASEDEYLAALADALHDEYKIIVDCGLPAADRRSATRHLLRPQSRHQPRGVPRLHRAPGRGAEPRAARPAGRPRALHTCYSTNVAPRVHDLELKDFVDLMLKIRAGGLFDRGVEPAPRA